MPETCPLVFSQREVGQHEPASALDGGGAAGLGALRDITSAAVDMLQPGGRRPRRGTAFRQSWSVEAS